MYIIIVLVSMITTMFYINYNKILLLNDFRVQNNISLYRMSKSIIYTMFTFIYIQILMYLQNKLNNWTIREIEKNIFEICLVVNNKVVKILVKVKKGPNKILQIVNDKDEDVTEELQPYYACKYVNCNPDIHGYKSINVMFVNGYESIIRGEEAIN